VLVFDGPLLACVLVAVDDVAVGVSHLSSPASRWAVRRRRWILDVETTRRTPEKTTSILLCVLLSGVSNDATAYGAEPTIKDHETSTWPGGWRKLRGVVRNRLVFEEVPMPWMPEFFTVPVAEALRGREAASANDAVAYYEGIMAGEPDALARSFASRPVLDDPRVGYVEGDRRLRAFVNGTADWLRERDAVVENMALTRTPTRTVEEVVLRLLVGSGERVELPVAVVSDRNPDRTLKAIRVYHSMWPLTGGHRVRGPLLPKDPNLVVPDVVGEYQRALAAGDLEAVLATYEEDAYAREPSGGEYVYRGKEKLREVYSAQFANGGGIPLEHCTVTDDGVRCAVEFNAVRWGVTEIPPQAGVAVYERGESGRLAGGRIYDDVQPPAVSDTSVG
jgi:hypothetical protein